MTHVANIQTSTGTIPVSTVTYSYSVPSWGVFGCRDALAAFRDAKRKAKKKGHDTTQWKLVYID